MEKRWRWRWQYLLGQLLNSYSIVLISGWWIYSKKFFEVQLTFNVVLISALQQSDSVMQIYFIFHILFHMFHHRISNIVPCAIQEDLGVNPSTVIVCLCQSQTPNPSLSPPPPATTSLLHLWIFLLFFLVPFCLVQFFYNNHLLFLSLEGYNRCYFKNSL